MLGGGFLMCCLGGHRAHARQRAKRAASAERADNGRRGFASVVSGSGWAQSAHRPRWGGGGGWWCRLVGGAAVAAVARLRAWPLLPAPPSAAAPCSPRPCGRT